MRGAACCRRCSASRQRCVRARCRVGVHGYAWAGARPYVAQESAPLAALRPPWAACVQRHCMPTVAQAHATRMTPLCDAFVVVGAVAAHCSCNYDYKCTTHCCCLCCVSWCGLRRVGEASFVFTWQPAKRCARLCARTRACRLRRAALASSLAWRRAQRRAGCHRAAWRRCARRWSWGRGAWLLRLRLRLRVRVCVRCGSAGSACCSSALQGCKHTGAALHSLTRTALHHPPCAPAAPWPHCLCVWPARRSCVSRRRRRLH